MFIKKTLRTDPRTGNVYHAYHLVEAIRTEKGPRQRMILYMGTEIDLPEGDHKMLAQRIEEIIKNYSSLFPYAENLERLAQKYASQVIQRLSDNPPKEKGCADEKTEFMSIDVNSIETSDPRTVGNEHLLLQMAEQLQLSKQLRAIGLSETDLAIALGTIIARAVAPDSERATHFWLCNTSGIGELLDFDFGKSSLKKLYKISDKLLQHKDWLERHLEHIESKFHGYKSTIAFYDLTNVYMEGQAKKNPKAAYGVSKEKRRDCKLVTLGLVMNEHGFLSRTSILPGNASEPKTLEEMIQKLDVQSSLFKPTILLDAGIATEDNLSWLRKNGYTYVVCARQNAPSDDLEGELVPVGDRHNFVKAALIKGDVESDERWLYCESQAKALVAEGMKQSFKARFEEDLKNISDGLAKKKARKKLQFVHERIGRLKERHKRISGGYEINIIASEDGKTACKVEWKVIEEKMSAKLAGHYLLRTNLLNMDARELWQLYNTLRGVEDAFRFMKSSLGLRPVYHQYEHRVDGHLWITVLAYHLIQNCIYQLNKNGITNQWQTIRKILSNRVRVTTQATAETGKTLYYRSTTRANADQMVIYRTLGLSSSILRSKKIVV